MRRNANNCAVMSEDKMHKLTMDAMSYATQQTSIISKILNPHRYDTGESVYGQNSITAMWNDSAYDINAWPDYKRPVLIMKETNPVVDFYEPLLVRMRTEYFDHAFHKHGYKTRQELRKIPQFDISKICSTAKSFKNIKFDISEELQLSAKNYGIDVFIPCLPEYAIKVDPNHVLLVKLLHKDSDNSLYCIEFEDYLIDKTDIACIVKITINAQYDTATGSIEWDATSYTAYEDFLSQDIDDMKWSAKEQKFWKDVFGIEDNDNIIEVTGPFAFDDADRLFVTKSPDNCSPMFLHSQSVIDYLQKTLRQMDLPEMKVIDRGESVHNKLVMQKITKVYPNYLTAIAAVNTILIQNQQNFILPEDATVIRIGDLAIKTQTPLRLNLKL